MAVITDSTFTYTMGVDSNSNAKVNLPTVTTQAGFVCLASQIDTGATSGAALTRAIKSSPEGQLRVSLDNILFSETFPSAALNSALWTAPVTTMTVTSSGGFANLNAASSIAASAVARMQTYRQFTIFGGSTARFDTTIQFSSTPVTNNVCEWGLFHATTTAAPLDGVFFRYNATGELRAVINSNGTENQSANLVGAAGVSTAPYTIVAYSIVLNDDACDFWMNGVRVATVARPNSFGVISNAMSLPIAYRNYNNASGTSTAQIMKIGKSVIAHSDYANNMNYLDMICASGGGGYQGQTTGTMGSTALYTNSLAAGAGVAPTNTTAALGSGLGGQFSSQPTLAAGTDGIISSYQVPIAGTAILQGKCLLIKGVRIQGLVTTALTGGPVYYAYSLAYGHTAVSLATAEAATTKAARRIALGYETYIVTAPVGTLGQGVTMKFDCPPVVQQGEFIQIVAKNLGTVTTAGVITILVTFDCVWV